ncbi:zeta toxin family protein [Patescibacteria group bacterium]|nr:zeta toxin family protein [Patescibacteria group bacterium]
MSLESITLNNKSRKKNQPETKKEQQKTEISEEEKEAIKKEELERELEEKRQVLEEIRIRTKIQLSDVDRILTELSEVSGITELINMFNKRINSNEIIHLAGTLVETCQDTLLVINTQGKLEEFSCASQEETLRMHEYIEEHGEHFGGNSYLLRREIIERSQGQIDTDAAYSIAILTPDTQEFHFTARDGKKRKWIEERKVVHRALKTIGIEEARALSERYGEKEPTIIILRGNTAVGKSTSLRKNPLFSKILDKNGNPTGAANPDNYKNLLQNLELVDDKPAINSSQCHNESSILNKEATQELIKDYRLSLVMDQRFASQGSVELMNQIAESTGRKVKILDIESSLELSCIRVLGRDIYEPRPNLKVVSDGFEGVRNNRQAVTNLAENNNNVEYYLLYDASEQGELIELAEKKDGDFKVRPNQENRFDEVTYSEEVVQKQTIRETESIKITQEYIMKASRKFKLRPNQIIGLERYIGSTLKEGLDENSKSLN